MAQVKIQMYEKFPEIKGVFAGGCVKRGEGSRFRALAHAHTNKNDEYHGWICILSVKRINQKYLLLHEAAHIITGEGHTDKWRAKLKEIGGRIERRYRKQKRMKGGE